GPPAWPARFDLRYQGNLLVANADPNVSQDPNEPSEIVEFTKGGQFVRQYSVDPNLGSAFALGVRRQDEANVFAYVDDFLSTSRSSIYPRDRSSLDSSRAWGSLDQCGTRPLTNANVPNGVIQRSVSATSANPAPETSPGSSPRRLAAGP